jgi:hypothetical protein
MYALKKSEPETITLHVADPRHSAQFYRDLLGLSSETPGHGRTIMLGDTNVSPEQARLVLRFREEEAEPGSGLWLSVEVDTVTDVLDLYLLSIILGARAMLPRKRGGRWNTVVTDPDGYRISIWTHMPQEQHERRFEGPTLDRATRSSRFGWEHPPRRGEDVHDRPARATDTEGRERIPGRELEHTEPLERGAATADEGV